MSFALASRLRAISSSQTIPNLALSIATLLAISSLYVLVAYSSPGYDDEFYNISVVEQAPSFLAMIYKVSHEDVHPVGQYVFNYVLYDISGSWKFVRIFGGVLTSVSLFIYISYLNIRQTYYRAIAFVLLAMNSSFLLWCTGVRWYAYFTPVFIFAIIWLQRNTRSAPLFWSVLCSLLVVLFYINYIIIIIAPLMVAIAAVRRREHLLDEFRASLFSLLIAALICLPQIYYFYVYQLPNKAEQVGGMLQSLLGTIQGLFITSGIFPLSFLGILSILLISTAIVCVLKYYKFRVLEDYNVILISCAAILVAASGIGIKARNLTALVPLALGTIIFLASNISNRRQYMIAKYSFMLLAIINIVGINNVVNHTNTTKGSWNLPVQQVKSLIEERRHTCSHRVVVAVTDPVLAYTLPRSNDNISVASPYYGGPVSTAIVAEPGDCLMALLTYHGAMSNDTLKKLLGDLPAKPIQKSVLGRDSYADIKQIFDREIPEYYIRVLDYGDLRDRVTLSNWIPGPVY